MLESGTLVLYPGLPMLRFGEVDPAFGGGNKYRIVWAPSRMVVLTGRDKTMTVPMYVGPHALEPVGDFWILEGWKSCYDICGAMTSEQWNADPMLLNTGPFPSRGDYVRHETFAATPTSTGVEKLISWIEEGGKRRAIENAQAVQQNLEYALTDKRNKRDALIRDAMRFGGAINPMVGYNGGRGTKTFPVLKSWEQSGLPGAGQTVALKRKPVMYEVPQEA